MCSWAGPATRRRCLGYLAAWFGIVLGPISFFRNAFPRATPTKFRATVTGISIDGHGELRSEDIVEAKVIPRPELRETLLALADAHDDASAEAALASLRR